MMDGKVSINIAPPHWDNRFSVWLTHESGDGVTRVAPTCVFAPVTEGEAMPPTFVLHQEQAQALFNQLWNMGLRPNDGGGSAVHVQAMKEHIADLRKVAFGHLDARPDMSQGTLKLGSGGKG
jgi:hypothetical protein